MARKRREQDRKAREKETRLEREGRQRGERGCGDTEGDNTKRGGNKGES